MWEKEKLFSKAFSLKVVKSLDYVVHSETVPSLVLLAQFVSLIVIVYQNDRKNAKSTNLRLFL